MSDQDETVGGRIKRPTVEPRPFEQLMDACDALAQLSETWSSAATEMAVELEAARAKCEELQEKIKSRDHMIGGLLRWLAEAEKLIQKLEELHPAHSEVEIAVPLGNGSAPADGVGAGLLHGPCERKDGG